MRRPILWILLALCSCRSKDIEDVSTGRVDLKSRQHPSKVLRKPRKPDEWFEKEIETVALERKQGKIREAIIRIYAARDEYPARRHRMQLDGLLGQLNQDVLDLETITAWVEVSKDPVGFGEPLRLRIHLRNGSNRRIKIPARRRKSSSSVFLLKLVRRDYDVRAHISIRSTLVRRNLTVDLDIPAGGSTDQILILNADDIGNDSGLEGFRTFTVGGMLRPAVLEIGGLRRWEAIRIKSVMVRSFRPNWEHLAKDPLKKVGLALKREWGVHLLTASALLANGDRQKAVDLMVDNLRGDRRIDWATFAALQHLTNLNMGRDASAWRAWWPRVRTTFFVEPTKKPKDKPVFD